ncbi:delta-class carbonic anhydrase [Pseudosulfitobacter sp. DSM 107133]|uniref:delta-class carbonic anhydrase n=1 Tax=Pseudosulfitobacter sp. DSM 107133 TaxID=2883100 RepID=UPI000DF37DEB|nr:delta-class carbonic anhydrase [Pseudosulfitobacter sp. DSM 107133]UOA26278.1 hypothetical protein DSM107133_00975 [Pseudosulfitobacter sp. DSM 107133]
MTKKSISVLAVASASLLALNSIAMAATMQHEPVSGAVIAKQRAALAESTKDAGFGPQSPRDIDDPNGNNHRAFSTAPAYTQMNLCDIHFHENAEHRGGEFTKYAGNGDGHGYDTGFQYDGKLTDAELKPVDHPIGKTEHGDLKPGDTIEAHFVYSTAQAKPGPTLGTCLSDAINNPQLRVEAQVFVLVNDPNALDFTKLADVEVVNGLYQAPNIPTDTGTPVVYDGSTTGPGYNEKGSPFEVTWSVHPKVARVDINTVDKWLQHNEFEEDHAHGVRNLVVNPDLLSQIDK